MKKKSITVSIASEIPAAVEFAEHAASLSGKKFQATGLITEELLSYLLSSGFPSVTVSKASSDSLKISAAGPPVQDSFALASGKDEMECLEAEIRQNILENYWNHIDYCYRDGANCFRILFGKFSAPDLREEISGFYKNTAQEGEDPPPLSVLRHVAGNHKILAALCMANRSVKHLAALMLPVFAANIIDVLATSHSILTPVILWNVFASCAALAVNLICAWLDNRYYHTFTRAMETGFKMAIVQKLQILSMKYHRNAQNGKILSKLVSDVQFIQILLYDLQRDILHLGLDVVFIAIVSAATMPVMLLFYAVAIPLMAWLYHHYMKPIWESKLFLRKKTEKSNSSFKEMLEMNEVVRSHGLEKKEYRNISSIVRQVQNAANLHDIFQIRLNNMGYGTTQGLRILCLCLASWFALSGHITIGDLVLFLSLFDVIINSTQKVLDDMPQITQGYDSLKSIGEILWERDTERNGTLLLPEPVRGEITVRDLVYRYAPEDPAVLSHVSFSVAPGECIAFIGKSGMGKTTLLNLLLGIYSKESGQILIDGIDVDDLNKSSYRRNISVVPQNTALFSGTLWENLVYGLSYVSTAQVMKVLKSVGLESLYASHPDGLQRAIYEGGENLSGGQRQRISIARALLRNPRIIFFDEATSALDTESEQKVQQAVEALIGSATVLMVAHKLNTLQKADRIYRVENGNLTLCDSLAAITGTDVASL